MPRSALSMGSRSLRVYITINMTINLLAIYTNCHGKGEVGGAFGPTLSECARIRWRALAVPSAPG